MTVLKAQLHCCGQLVGSPLQQGGATAKDLWDEDGKPQGSQNEVSVRTVAIDSAQLKEASLSPYFTVTSTLYESKH